MQQKKYFHEVQKFQAESIEIKNDYLNDGDNIQKCK